MRFRLLAAAAAALVLPAATAASAQAGEPIMRLSDVHAGMRCTGYSVVRGTDIASFDVEVLDVVDGDPEQPGPRILVRVSGPAVDETGVGPGFSGSPIRCRDAAGTPRNIGAISESIGEYGGKVVLATPIEQILGTPVSPPSGRASRAHAALAARARPLAEPLVVAGLSAPLARALGTAGARLGRPLLAAPAGPLGGFPAQRLQPGSAVGVGYSNGDLRLGAIGTVAYTDGDRVWAFGHPFDGVGRRALLLQDAYVYRVIDNPIQDGDVATYKLASPGHDLGTLSSDGIDAVAGRVGGLPHTVPVEVVARDADTGRTRTVATRVADEAAIDLPTGASPLEGIAPLAVAQAATEALGATPGRVSGTMCARIAVRELRGPLGFCNRYVSAASELDESGQVGNALTSAATSDVVDAVSAVEAYQGRTPHVTGITVGLTLHHGTAQAFLRGVRAPRRVRAGRRVTVSVRLQHARGTAFTRRYRLRIPRGISRGPHALRLAGHDVDGGAGDLAALLADLGGGGGDDTAGSEGPRSLAALRRVVSGIARYDGVTLRLGDARAHAFRDARLRISGRARTVVHVVGGRR